MKAGFIGAGKVGFSLGKYLAENGVQVTGYYSRNSKSARQAAEFTSTKHFTNLTDIVKESDTLFITVPDGAISEVWEHIRSLPIKNKNICHCSGSIPSTAFFNAEELGAYRYSIHPLQALSNKYESYKSLKNTYFTIEGSASNLDVITDCFSNMGNPVVTIDQKSKTLYHCAAAVASNHMTALIDIAAEMLEKCGFSRSDALEALAPLLMNNLSCILTRGTEKALTGPIERNDISTVNSHLLSLNEFMPESVSLYQILSGRLVRIAKSKHPERNYDDMMQMLK